MTIQYACARLGIILCTINPFYQALEFNYVLRRADVKALFMPGKKSAQEQINRFSKVLADGLALGSDEVSQSLHLATCPFFSL